MQTVMLLLLPLNAQLRGQSLINIQANATREATLAAYAASSYFGERDKAGPIEAANLKGQGNSVKVPRGTPESPQGHSGNPHGTSAAACMCHQQGACTRRHASLDNGWLTAMHIFYGLSGLPTSLQQAVHPECCLCGAPSCVNWQGILGCQP